MSPHNAAAIDLARLYLDSKPGDRATIGAERAAAQRALDETPGCTWSTDQLRARAFNPDCKDMFWSMGRPA
jgi:hypothetical protein